MTTWTRDQYDTLCMMIGKGVTSLETDTGEKVVYRSLEDMLRIKRLMEVELGITIGRRLSYPVFRKG